MFCKFQWSDGSAWNFTSWDETQPDNYHNYEYYVCANFKENLGTPGAWADVNDDYSYVFVCEYEINY